MTRKDYELIAQSINSIIKDEELTDYDGIMIASRLANDLKSTNPNFNHKRFVDASTQCIADRNAGDGIAL